MGDLTTLHTSKKSSTDSTTPSYILKSFSAQYKDRITLEYHPHNLMKFLTSGGSAHSPGGLHQTEAIIYLYSKDVIHRDLSPHNTLITAQGNTVLCDFASSSLDGN
jgi:serine/threonine protein kinase